MPDLYRNWRITMLAAAIVAAGSFLISIGLSLVEFVLSTAQTIGLDP